jgi:hypothetical protein
MCPPKEQKENERKLAKRAPARRVWTSQNDGFQSTCVLKSQGVCCAHCLVLGSRAEERSALASMTRLRKLSLGNLGWL